VDHVDNYCERVGPGLWGEPANALTNVAFLIASGVLFWLLSRQPRSVPVGLWLLAATTAVVGLCSLTFHTFATRFTGLLDSLSIVVFILIAAVVAVRLIWDVPWRWAWLAAPGYLAFMLGFTATLATVGGVRTVVGGYLSALVVLVGFGLAVRLTAPSESRRFGTLLLWAAGLFAVSLTLRTLDGPLCGELPVGTHFLWHCFNATVMFLVSYTVIRCWQE
jgi:antibiotic biosynthesis monooxygenase (ABM) superfamily enzyme